LEEVMEEWKGILEQEKVLLQQEATEREWEEITWRKQRVEWQMPEVKEAFKKDVEEESRGFSRPSPQYIEYLEALHGELLRYAAENPLPSFLNVCLMELKEYVLEEELGLGWYWGMRSLSEQAKVEQKLFTNELRLRKEIARNFERYYRNWRKLRDDIAAFRRHPLCEFIKAEYPEVAWYKETLQEKKLELIFDLLQAREPLTEAAEAIRRSILRLNVELATKAASNIPIVPMDIQNLVAGLQQAQQIVDQVIAFSEKTKTTEEIDETPITLLDEQ
jgi:hypothetical protein